MCSLIVGLRAVEIDHHLADRFLRLVMITLSIAGCSLRRHQYVMVYVDGNLHLTAVMTTLISDVSVQPLLQESAILQTRLQYLQGQKDCISESLYLILQAAQGQEASAAGSFTSSSCAASCHSSSSLWPTAHGIHGCLLGRFHYIWNSWLNLQSLGSCQDAFRALARLLGSISAMLLCSCDCSAPQQRSTNPLKC